LHEWSPPNYLLLDVDRILSIYRTPHQRILTCRTFSLPSSGFTSGRMKLIYDASAQPAPLVPQHRVRRM
jgi:hypothetical protein